MLFWCRLNRKASNPVGCCSLSKMTVEAGLGVTGVRLLLELGESYFCGELNPAVLILQGIDEVFRGSLVFYLS